MANATWNMARTTNSYTTIRRAKQLARFPSNSDGLNALGANANDRNLMIVDLLHEAQRDFLKDFPKLMVSSLSITATASTRVTALSATIRMTDILDLYWDGVAGDPYEKSPLTLISRQQLMSLPPILRSSDHFQDYPDYACISWLQTVGGLPYIEWFPMPEVTRTATMWLRVKEEVFTTVDIAAEASIKYIAAPDEMGMLFADYLALQFIRATLGSHTQEYASKKRDVDMGRTEWAGRLANTPLERRRQTMDRGGHPRLATQKGLYTYDGGGKF